MKTRLSLLHPVHSLHNNSSVICTNYYTRPTASAIEQKALTKWGMSPIDQHHYYMLRHFSYKSIRGPPFNIQGRGLGVLSGSLLHVYKYSLRSLSKLFISCRVCPKLFIKKKFHSPPWTLNGGLLTLGSGL